MLYTHDYTPQGYYLTKPQQLGPIYFKTPNKFGIFGICCKSIPWQINYFMMNPLQLEKEQILRSATFMICLKSMEPEKQMSTSMQTIVVARTKITVTGIGAGT